MHSRRTKRYDALRIRDFIFYPENSYILTRKNIAEESYEYYIVYSKYVFEYPALFSFFFFFQPFIKKKYGVS